MNENWKIGERKYSLASPRFLECAPFCIEKEQFSNIISFEPIWFRGKIKEFIDV